MLEATNKTGNRLAGRKTAGQKAGAPRARRRNSAGDGKGGPCGRAQRRRGANYQYQEPGQDI